MVRAILEGRKTMTRRIITDESIISLREDGTPGKVQPRSRYGKPGDRLWVRETWAPHADMPTRAAIYRCDRGGDYQDNVTEHFRWRPSIHMPRWASRIDLEITGVRVERLKEISNEDCWNEGMSDETNPQLKANRKWFSELWESINGVGSWDSNPWVWVVEFRRVKP